MSFFRVEAQQLILVNNTGRLTDFDSCRVLGLIVCLRQNHRTME